MGTIIGLDYGPVMAMCVDLGVDRRIAAALLPSVDQGVVAAMTKGNAE
jgi:hypothetical protein